MRPLKKSLGAQTERKEVLVMENRVRGEVRRLFKHYWVKSQTIREAGIAEERSPAGLAFRR